jgi:Nucleotidyl transferase AbiEii toxin, Type IV TA system
MNPATGNQVLDRMVSAVEKVRQRLIRSTTALQVAKVPYAVAGGNAVAAWVATVDEAAVRNTQDVDILIRRADLSAATSALEANGFTHRHSAGLDIFLDNPGQKARDAVHILFAGEKVKPTEMLVNPDVTDSQTIGTFNALSLRALVQIKLTAFCDKDRTHLRDLIDVGLLDQTWPARFPAELAARLQLLLDTPGG